MTPTDLASMLQAIASQAKDLRAAGVLSFQVGDVRVELAPNEPPAAVPLVTQDGKTAEQLDLLEDPDTFGGHLPQRRGHDHATAEDDDGRPDR